MGAKYGQHFLINKHAIDRIAATLDISAQDAVLEIGPGKGSLTAGLLKAEYLGIIEIDPDMIELLRARFTQLPQVHLFHDDILKFDFAKLPKEKIFKVAGNLPYNLTSPILRRLSDWTGWTTALVMVQREVADRLCAKAGTSDYGALTVGMNLTCEMEFVFELSPSSFNPRPKVTSAVVKLTRRASPLSRNIEQTQRVIQAAFQQRRKTILNSLSHGLNIDKAVVEAALRETDVDVGVRPERIPVETFVRLSEVLSRTERRA